MDNTPAPGGRVPRRRVLVTGASGGIGSAVAHAFAELGDRVAVHCNSAREKANAVRAELRGDGHVVVEGDIATGSTTVVQATVDALGGIDVLVNNAAVVTPAHPVSTDFADWQQAWRTTFEVNVLGTAAITHQVAARMVEQGIGGRIVNVGSRGAFRGEPEHPAYGASKAALHSMGQSLAVSLAKHRIAVSTVAPGFVRTDRVEDRLAGDGGRAIAQQSPFERVALPSEVAAAVVYLASREALWASGTILDLNGASYLRT
ncbi:SDR family NAD(P)-dependent oxidoreductase [Actinokineospora guangxiensis]|uniref:SDR family NAD(P)-dependent oxidoreductase n=1 Tax=Actinokineospora guangxiensis TaxID=1490288 RepID=A0ABW0EN61_9PSEU